MNRVVRHIRLNRGYNLLLTFTVAIFGAWMLSKSKISTDASKHAIGAGIPHYGAPLFHIIVKDFDPQFQQLTLQINSFQNIDTAFFVYVEFASEFQGTIFGGRRSKTSDSHITRAFFSKLEDKFGGIMRSTTLQKQFIKQRSILALTFTKESFRLTIRNSG